MKVLVATTYRKVRHAATPGEALTFCGRNTGGWILATTDTEFAEANIGCRDCLYVYESKTRVVHRCIKCGFTGLRTSFAKNGRWQPAYCKPCFHKARNDYYASNPEYRETKRRCNFLRRRNAPELAMWWAAKYRASKKGAEFTITVDDIRIPRVCPLLGIELHRESGSGKFKDWSPSLDRIDPRAGYVPGNVWVISYRANRIKLDSSIEELEQLTAGLKHKVFRAKAATWFSRKAA